MLKHVLDQVHVATTLSLSFDPPGITALEIADVAQLNEQNRNKLDLKVGLH